MPSNLDDHDFFEDDEEASCCDNPKMSEEDGFYVCLNCGFVHSRILDDSSRRAFTREDIQKRKNPDNLIGQKHIFTETIIRGNKDARGNSLNPKYKSKFQKLARIDEYLIFDTHYNINGELDCCENPEFGIKDGFCMCLNCGWLFTDDKLDGLKGNIHLVQTISSGINIDNNNIVGLNFFGCGLETFPDSFGNLLSIEELRLQCNELRMLPDSIGNLKLLQVLLLSVNRLNSLPESIGNLKSLQTLYLAHNELTTLPESIGNLKSLQTLNLANNKLTTLPESIGNLKSLQTLNLSDNQIKTLPESIGSLSSLKELNIKDNQLISLPESIENLKSLKKIILGFDQLKFLPKSLKDKDIIKVSRR